MSFEDSQNMACFFKVLSHSFFGRSGPGPLGPVRKILVVRSGPEGPQFARSVGNTYQLNNNPLELTLALEP